MSQSMPLPSEVNHVGWDSLTADIVLADDRGDTAVLPADPEILERFLNECRQLGLRPNPKTPHEPKT